MSKKFNDEICPITLEPLSKIGKILTLPCGHRFDCDPIREFLSRKGFCPVCKKKQNLESLNIIFVGEPDSDMSNTSDKDNSDDNSKDDKSEDDDDKSDNSDDDKKNIKNVKALSKLKKSNEKIQTTTITTITTTSKNRPKYRLRSQKKQQHHPTVISTNQINLLKPKNKGLLEYYKVCGEIPSELETVKDDIALDSSEESENEDSEDDESTQSNSSIHDFIDDKDESQDDMHE